MTTNSTAKARRFMGDLLQLLAKRQDLARGEVVSIWLGAESADPDLAEARAIVQDIVFKNRRM